MRTGRLVFGLAAAIALRPNLAFAATIALVLPAEDRFDSVASRVEQGARAAIERLADEGRAHDLTVVRMDCAGDEVAAAQLVAQAPDVVAGPLCFEPAKQIARAGREAGIATPVVALETRSPLLADVRRREGLAIQEFSLAPDAEARAVTDLLLPQFEGRPYAVLDDGSVYGRGLADRVRSLAEERGLAPVLSANFRPLQTTQRALLRRLSRSGVEALFVAASPEDIATIDRDLRALGLDWQLAIGAQTQMLPYVENGARVRSGLLGLASARLDPAANAVGRQDDAEDGDEWRSLGSALIQIADAAAGHGNPDLAGLTVKTVLGSRTFDGDGRAVTLPYGAVRWTGSAFEPL